MSDTYVIITDLKLAEPDQRFFWKDVEYLLLTVKQNADGSWSHEALPCHGK